MSPKIWPPSWQSIFVFKFHVFYYFLQLKFDHRQYGVDWSVIMVSTKIGTRIQIHLGYGPCDDRIPIWEKSEKNKIKQTKFDLKKLTNVFFLKHGIDDKIFGFNFWQQNSVKIRHHKTNKLCSQKVGKCFFSKTWNLIIDDEIFSFNFWGQNSVKIRHKKPRRNHWSDSCYGR